MTVSIKPLIGQIDDFLANENSTGMSRELLRRARAALAHDEQAYAESDLYAIAEKIKALALHPVTSEEYDAGYIAARNDAFAIVQELIDNSLHLTAPSPEQASVPDGWKLVPIKPTEAMCRAGESSAGASKKENWIDGFYTPENVELIWRDMLAASPRSASCEGRQMTTPSTDAI